MFSASQGNELFLISFFSSVLFALKEAFFFGIVAIAISYLILPIAKLFNRIFGFILPTRIAWNIASVFSFISIFSLLGFGIFISAPIVATQFMDLVKIVTDHSFIESVINLSNSSIAYVSSLLQSKTTMFDGVLSSLDLSFLQIPNPKEISSFIASFLKEFMSGFGRTGKSIFYAYLMASLYLAASFHIIREWPKWPQRFEHIASWFTRSNSRRFLFFIDSFSTGIKSWIMGQASISLIMSIYYSIAFSAVGIIAPVGIGVMFGFSAFLPYIGDILSSASLIASCIYAQASVAKILSVLGVIVAGHALGGHILGPILIGSHTGVNPVQSIVGFIVYSQVFGFPGIFLSIPISLFINSFVASYFYKERCNFENMHIKPDDS